MFSTCLSRWCICLFGLSGSLRTLAPKLPHQDARLRVLRVERSLMAPHFIQLADAVVQSDLQFIHTHSLKDTTGREENRTKAGFTVNTKVHGAPAPRFNVYTPSFASRQHHFTSQTLEAGNTSSPHWPITALNPHMVSGTSDCKVGKEEMMHRFNEFRSLTSPS